MNFQPPSPTTGGMHRITRVLSILVVQHLLVFTGTDAYARTRLPSSRNGDGAGDLDSRPYLKVAGSLALRFAAAPQLPPTLVTNAWVPSTTSETIAPAPAESFPPPVTPTIEPTPIQDQPIASTNAPAGNKPSLNILPDDTRPSTRPEDFLPFFQFPSGDVTVVVPATVHQSPAPGQLPVSSATYQQR